MKPAELARKAAEHVRAFYPSTTQGVASSWSHCMLDALMTADGFANSDAAIAVVNEIGWYAPPFPHRWNYFPEVVRAEVVRGFELVAVRLEAAR